MLILFHTVEIEVSHLIDDKNDIQHLDFSVLISKRAFALFRLYAMRSVRSPVLLYFFKAFLRFLMAASISYVHQGTALLRKMPDDWGIDASAACFMVLTRRSMLKSMLWCS